MIEDAIVAQLIADSGVGPLIGNRIYADYVRQADKVYPLCVYKVESVASQMASDGPTGLQSADMTIACLSPSKIAAGQLATAVLAALDGQGGMWSGIRVQGCFLKEDGVNDSVVTEPVTEEILVYGKECSFEIKYST